MLAWTNLRKRVSRFLEIRNAESPEKRKKNNLDIVLVGITVISIPTFMIYMVASLFVDVTSSEMRLLSWSFILFITCMTGLYLLNQKISGNLASHLFMFFFYSFIIVSDTFFEVTRGRGLILFTIPIMLSSMLLDPSSSFIAAGVSGLIVALLSKYIGLVPDIGAVSSFLVLGAVSYLMGKNQNQAIDQLRSLNIVLDKKVEERTKDLIKANNRLQNLSDMKTRFVSTATHELRTPLTSMKGYLELISDEELTPIVTNYLEVINRNVNRLEALTDDLLNQQRIEEGRLNLVMESILFQSLILEAIDEIKGVFNQAKHNFIVNLPENSIYVIGDKLRLQQVTANLLDNAIKYSPDKSEINVTMHIDRDFVELAIQDEGIGLSEEDMIELFKPFPNIDRPVLTRQSVGLGLSISRGIIEMHGGMIWAESRGKGKGSVFKYVLPRKPVE